jgi:putative transposase
MPDWPHAPPHRLLDRGAYFVTASTLHKALIFRDPDRLSLLQHHLLTTLGEYGWRVQAWAVFGNHYHVVALAPVDPGTLSTALSKVHTLTATEVNHLDATAGRQVWFQFRDTALTFQRSYFARLRYVHENAVHHGLVQRACDYPWCSAGWLEQHADPAFRKMLSTFRIDRLSVPDDYEVAGA